MRYCVSSNKRWASDKHYRLISTALLTPRSEKEPPYNKR